MKSIVTCLVLLLSLQLETVLGVGGYSPMTDTEESKSVVEESIPLITSKFGADSSECQLKVKDIKKAESQIVAGVNYRFEVEFESSGENCKTETKLCKGIVINQPLPYACSGFSNSRCLTLSPNANIECSKVD